MKNKTKFQKDTNWIHFTGIAGVALAPLAIELKKLGHKVTGTDTDIYEPIKGLLKTADIDLYNEYTFLNLVDGDFVPHLVITGAGVSQKNKELLFGKKQEIAIKHFAEALGELIIENNSVVVAGTYAKTTITAMLVRIFQETKSEISYMFGGVTVDGLPSAHLKTAKTLFSVVEGDEYISSRWDIKSKFFYYKPKYLILTGIKWDHTDIFKTEKEYINNFQKLVEQVPQDGIIFANFSDKNVKKVASVAKCKVIRYTSEELEKWVNQNNIEVSILGSFNTLNAAVAAKFAVDILKQDLGKVQMALKNFEGIKRRLEIRYFNTDGDLNDSQIIVLDDFASSPPKVAGAINAIKGEFPKHKLVIVYEPNTGNRTKGSLGEFEGVFDDVEALVLPKFKKLMKSTETKFLNEKEFAKGIGNHSNVSVYENDKDLINSLVKLAENKPTVIAFMSSQGMEDRIQSLIAKL